MNREELSRLLDAVACGAVKPAVAADQLVAGPFRRTELEFATLDHHRSLRHRMGEVVYGEGKTAAQCVAIVERLAATGAPVLVTRLDAERSAALRHHFPEGRENRSARTFIANAPAVKGSASGEPFVAIIAAGTSDLPVAEEAAEVCVAGDTAFERICDVGVAGLHRLLHRFPKSRRLRRSSSWPAWKARCRVSSRGSWADRCSRCRRVLAMAQVSGGLRHCWRCSTRAHRA